MLYKPHPYQVHATEHILNNPYAGLFLDMGLGKTVSTLSAIVELMDVYCEVERTLVIAPKRVAEDTWSTEISKWDHLKHLKISKVLGTEKQRKIALKAKADIYIINRENVSWLVAHYGGTLPFDAYVIDELSSFKSAKAARFKALRIARPKMKRVIGLTGTPAPNSLADLWPQMFLLDQGERLGKTLTGFRERYFTEGKRNGHVVYEYKLRQGEDLLGKDFYEKEIYEKISDICTSMKSEDYLDLPELIDRDIIIRMSPKVTDQYNEFERQQVLALQDVEEITAVNAAALTNKLLQFSNGAVYSADKSWHEVHRQKLEALEEIIDTAAGHPVLVFYSYQHDAERIAAYLKKYKPVKLEGEKEIRDWNQGKIRVMYAHPASAGHGLNLQAGGNIIVWFGLTWSLELYQQAVKRLHRQGQLKAVVNHRLITYGTMDTDVLAALDRKANSQEALLQAVKARIEKHLKPIS